MRVFFPIEEAGRDDETGPLVPYRYGLACAGAVRRQLVLRDGVWELAMPDLPAGVDAGVRARQAVLSG